MRWRRLEDDEEDEEEDAAAEAATERDGEASVAVLALMFFLFLLFQSSLVVRKPNCFFGVDGGERESGRWREGAGREVSEREKTRETEGFREGLGDRRKNFHASLSLLVDSLEAFSRTPKFLMMKMSAPVADTKSSSNSSLRANEEI